MNETVQNSTQKSAQKSGQKSAQSQPAEAASAPFCGSFDFGVTGQGMTAQLTALALVHAGWSIAIDPQTPPDSVSDPKSVEAPANGGSENYADPLMWQSVLALSPATGHMLARLGVALPAGQSIDAMWLDDRPKLRPAFVIQDQKSLATVYCRRALARATYTRFIALAAADNNNHAKGALFLLPSPTTRTQRKSDLSITGQLSNGQFYEAPWIIETRSLSSGGRGSGVPPTSSHSQPAPNAASQKQNTLFQGSYEAAALVCCLTFSQPHENEARQIFLDSGPLALLPLPDKTQRALIWSLPHRQAQAMRNLQPELLTHILQKHFDGFAPLGQLTAIGPRQTQPLSYYLTDVWAEDSHLRLGDAAHRLHPMAGQGFNLNCRDIATLIDICQHARHVGLGLMDPHLGAHYHRARMADASAVFALTHGLHHLTTGALPHRLITPAATLSALIPGLADYFIAQAQTGGDDLPALMRAS